MLTAMTTQYLQVPKALPHRRKSRSRSRPRAQDTSATQGIVVATSPPRLRSPSPPMLVTEAKIKPMIKKADMSNGRPGSNPSHPCTNGLTNHYVQVTSAEEERTNYDDLAEEQPYTLPKTPPPPEPPRVPLRQRLAGAWKLESYIAYPTPQSRIQRPTYPMTKNVTGFIMYTTDGYMSAQMLIPGQQSFKRGEGEEPQWAEAGKRFFAYSGPFYITEEGEERKEVLRHTFQVCNLPGWLGDIQIRTHKFIEDADGLVLELGSQEPTEIKGDKRNPVLRWRRMRDNANGVPPPPTPQIKISVPGES
nr:hypothetical protein CFP56_67700 [Quercus suber]